MSEEVYDFPRPRWLDWVEKNAHPKRFDFPRPKREPTRWQKRGPMTRRDWVRFYNWASKNAAAKELNPRKVGKPDDKQAKKKKKKKSFSDLVKTAIKLCKPKNPRDKYIYPPKPVYPYSPQIHYKKPAHHDPGRPFMPPKVPKYFHHIENETEFWSTLRFPIIRSALNYRPSNNVLELSRPRITPPEKPHCPIPDKPVEEVPERRRMSYRQWREHLRRLEYLAKPVIRQYYEDFYYY